jgi:hypothetical protein
LERAPAAKAFACGSGPFFAFFLFFFFLCTPSDSREICHNVALAGKTKKKIEFGREPWRAAAVVTEAEGMPACWEHCWRYSQPRYEYE